ncbi:RVT 1 domain containing protein [Asbolus verrucosus]|uniref:RVT 1 domain containing protein n=1 Tax=Asbolus verrucosus TaxID=1661398 RepID=A0A482VAA8_ASBVE|nr:RVT 1 domain containing protein [Asbolus verrucosus]
MHINRIPLAYTKLIKSYLENRKFYVRINKANSGERTEVPQGSTLGPVLYTIFTSDIPTQKKTITAMYADDAAILTASRRIDTITYNLQTHIKEIENWLQNWRIKVNAETSAAIIFTQKKFRHNPDRSIQLNNIRIPWGDEVNYLGVTMDTKLNFNKHIQNNKKKAYGIKSYLYPLLNKNSKLDVTTKINKYKSIRPTFTYAAEVWIQASRTQLRQLQILQNKTLRQCLDAPYYITNTYTKIPKIPTIEEHINKIATRTYEKMEHHPNKTIRDAINYDKNQMKRRKRSRNVL